MLLFKNAEKMLPSILLIFQMLSRWAELTTAAKLHHPSFGVQGYAICFSGR